MNPKGNGHTREELEALVGELHDMAERIIYRRDKVVGPLWDILADDANLLDTVAAILAEISQEAARA